MARLMKKAIGITYASLKNPLKIFVCIFWIFVSLFWRDLESDTSTTRSATSAIEIRICFWYSRNRRVWIPSSEFKHHVLRPGIFHNFGTCLAHRTMLRLIYCIAARTSRRNFRNSVHTQTIRTFECLNTGYLTFNRFWSRTPSTIRLTLRCLKCTYTI